MTRYLGLIFLVSSALANNPTDLYESKRSQILKKEELNRNILSQIYEMQRTLKRISAEKNKLMIKKEKLEHNISKLDPLVHSAEKKILNQKIEIQKRLLYILKFQDMSLLKVIFSSQTPSELDRNLRILKGLTERDYISLKSYFKNIKTLKAKQNELLSQKNSLLALEGAVQSKEADLTRESLRKNKMLSELSAQKSRLILSLKSIREKANRNAQDIQKQEFLEAILDPLFFEKKGQVLAPVQGRIAQKYGNFEHPVFGTQIRHKGLFFSTDTESEVKAVFKGRVVHVRRDPLAGYSIVIDHGDHYYSVYSYLNNFGFKENDVVSEGAVLAKSVTAHPFFGEGVYFELRHFSEPMNPVEWLKL